MHLPKLFTIPQAADVLGVHRATVYRLIADGDLDVTDVGTRRGGGTRASRIREDVLLEFIEKRTRSARALRR